MAKFFLKALLGFVVVFVFQALLRSAFAQVVGQRMLDSAGWTAGATPPTGYMVATAAVALVASTAAGGLGALIVGKTRFRLAVVYGAVITGMALWANWGTLFNAPHPYEWPLILAPLVAVPFGAYLVMRAKPPVVAETAVAAAGLGGQYRPNP